MKNEKRWIKTWLYGFNINLRSGQMIFETGGRAMLSSTKTFPYYRYYAQENMVQELKEDKWLIDKTVSFISSHIYVSLLIGNRYSSDEVLDIEAAHFNETSDHEGFFRDMDIPYDGLTDDEKDGW
jgi:hypothetical protein